jgi:pimeloyl-ACP methyl ester carboxylesterase
MQIELNYKEFGQGNPVIILHGLFGTLDNWQTIGRQLGEHFNVYTIDQRNHGRSPHTDDFNYTILANDLQYFMESHWIYKAHIVGHSMGGKTAMEFSLQYPDMVDKLVILDIAPKNYAGGHEEILDTLNAIDLDKIQDRKEAEALMMERIPTFGTRQFLLKNLTRNAETQAFEWKMNLPVLQKEYQHILGNISDGKYDGETLFVRGRNSDYIQDDEIENIKKYFPNMILETIEDAGHWIHAEQPKILLDMMQQFLLK